MTSDRLMMQGTSQIIGGLTLYFLAALVNSQMTSQYDEKYAWNGMIAA